MVENTIISPNPNKFEAAGKLNPELRAAEFRDNYFNNNTNLRQKTDFYPQQVAPITLIETYFQYLGPGAEMGLSFVHNYYESLISSNRKGRVEVVEVLKPGSITVTPNYVSGQTLAPTDSSGQPQQRKKILGII